MAITKLPGNLVICKGVKFSQQVVMHDDGVHLNNGVGIFKYYKAIRGAVVHGLSRL